MAALTVFVVRIAATRLALWPGTAWDMRKKHAMALSMCSLVSYGGLVVDNTLNAVYRARCDVHRRDGRACWP